MITKSELQEMIEREAWELCENDHDRDKDSYIQGAESLLPLLMKAIEALDFIQSNVVWCSETNQKVTLTYALGTVDKACRTLNEIREAVKGKK